MLGDPGMVIRGLVDDPVHHHRHSPAMSPIYQGPQVGEGSELRTYRIEIADTVRRIHRLKDPYRVNGHQVDDVGAHRLILFHPVVPSLQVTPRSEATIIHL